MLTPDGTLCLQELRSRGVAREHIDAALALVFGDTKQLPAWEPGNDAEEGENQLALLEPAAS